MAEGPPSIVELRGAFLCLEFIFIKRPDNSVLQARYLDRDTTKCYISSLKPPAHPS